MLIGDILGFVFGGFVGVLVWSLIGYLLIRFNRDRLGLALFQLLGLSEEEYRAVVKRVRNRKIAENIGVVDPSKGQVIGLCDCGCGQPVYWKGTGRKPRFAGKRHRWNYHNGLGPYIEDDFDAGASALAK